MTFTSAAYAGTNLLVVNLEGTTTGINILSIRRRWAIALNVMACLPTFALMTPCRSDVCAVSRSSQRANPDRRAVI
jgi:hypothetical protein